MLALLLACAETPEGNCPSFPDDPSAPPTVLENADDCGWWTLAVDEQLVVSVVITEADLACDGEAGAGLELIYEPSYANMSSDAPKWTFQFGGTEPADAATIAIACDEGTTWDARVRVE